MKITLILRTYNEEKNIERICIGYHWVDQILIADGGSDDKTVELAGRFSHVQVRAFSPIIRLKNGYARNPHGEHLNFLIDWATAEGADWIIHDDADCFPNYMVKEQGRAIMEKVKYDFIYITRLYLWKNLGHFPKLSHPVKKKRYEPSLWAWKTSSGFRFRTDTTPQQHQQFAFLPDESKILRLMPPYCLLHCPWQDDEMIEHKLKFYRESGEVKNMKHPLEYAGDVEPLPEWAREN